MTQNPYSQPRPWSLVSKGYEETTLHFLGRFALDALSTTPLTTSTSVLDVACGPGTVCRLIASSVGHIDALDFSPEMIGLFNDYLSQHTLSHVHTHVGDGQALPFKDTTFDVAISMFGLMFFPDRLKGFSELKRCLKPGGKALVSSWAPVSESPAMLLMFGCMKAGKPELPAPQANSFNLENPDVFYSEMVSAGFHHVTIRNSTQSFLFDSARHFWDFMVEGSAPIVMMKHDMTQEDWAIFESKALHYLDSEGPTFPTTLSSTAWIGEGIA